ncbi:hypothetical protein Rhopal_005033-T1 [Rhodotorula paludigena]|uniref:G-patch domain-containing protein n=1 Tax=Rhodotorula paludigena TaxID=86838 RepID=A0AAV5GQ57_9BASI|nr:hypothetical protein Rhopal_005033-T1 [Rhodotorula paludigena]
MSTARLKRKIELADEGQYGNLTESFVSVGTALPALTDSKKDKNEGKPAWEQEVYDEQGRRRFHGAFTGGFSAGYFNSVGSKEGWQPSTFKSSRSNRASQAQRSVADAAKDFMDAEDLAELASSRTLETSSAYASSSRGAPPPSAATYDPLLGNFGSLGSTAASATPTFDDTLASLIQPSSSRVGLKLMRKMGWREGQGVGPRLTFQQRKKQASELGVKLDDADDDEGGEAAKHYYAPLDRPLTLVKGTSASTDRGWGLGYKPGMNLNERLRQEGAGSSSARKPTYELDEDDVCGGVGMSVDALGDREKRAIGIYDADEEDEMAFGAMRSSRDRRVPQSSSRSKSAQQSFHDGSKVLPGFVLHHDPFVGSSNSQLPPQPPAGWEPNPARLWKENQPPSSTVDVKGKGRQLNADERGTLLGEQLPPPPPPVPKSVFDYLSAKSRERLATLTSTAAQSGSTAGTTDSPVAPTPPPPPDEELFVPPLDRPTALAALRGFQPYSAASTSPDAVKQARYTLYLQYQSSDSPSTTSSPFGPRTLPNGKMQTVSELNRELSEYAQAARVFKPVSGMLGNRFQTSRTGSLDVPKVEPGLYQPPPKAEKPPAANDLAAMYGDASSAPSKPPEPALTPAQAAARAGNFGPLTRTTTTFRPARLVCKRFGVRDPFEGAEVEQDGVGGAWGEATRTGWSTGNAQTQQPVGGGALEEMMQSAGFRRFQSAAEDEAKVDEDTPEVAKGTFETPSASSAAGAAAGSSKASAKKARPTIETVGYGDDEDQGQEILEEKKAPQDIFAAIFADSDDEDDEEDEDHDEPASVPPATVLSVDQPGAPAPAVAAAAAPPAPVTATIDDSPALSLDALASYRPSFVPSASRTKTDKPDKKKKKSSSKRKSVGLSFDVDEGGEDGDVATAPKKPRRERDKDRDAERDRERRRKREREEADEKKAAAGNGDKRRRSEEDRPPVATSAAAADDDEWDEAPSQVHPDVLAALQKPRGAGVAAAATAVPAGEEKAQPRGRMKASDLY